MLHALELMLAHVGALYTQDAAGDLLRVNEHNGAVAARFFLGRTAEGIVCRFRGDVDAALRRELEAAARRDVRGTVLDPAGHATASIAPYAEILARSAPIEAVDAGPAFIFPPSLPPADDDIVLVTEANVDVLEPLLPAWMPDVHHSPPLYALVVGDRALSVCGSVRRTAVAYEAGVDTATAFRGLGYAPRVVTAWAAGVRAMGITPMYSTSWENAASRAVARKLGLILFGEDLHLA